MRDWEIDITIIEAQIRVYRTLRHEIDLKMEKLEKTLEYVKKRFIETGK